LFVWMGKKIKEKGGEYLQGVRSKSGWELGQRRTEKVWGKQMKKPGEGDTAEGDVSGGEVSSD